MSSTVNNEACASVSSPRISSFCQVGLGQGLGEDDLGVAIPQFPDCMGRQSAAVVCKCLSARGCPCLTEPTIGSGSKGSASNTNASGDLLLTDIWICSVVNLHAGSVWYYRDFPHWHLSPHPLQVVFRWNCTMYLGWRWHFCIGVHKYLHCCRRLQCWCSHWCCRDRRPW